MCPQGQPRARPPAEETELPPGPQLDNDKPGRWGSQGSQSPPNLNPTPRFPGCQATDFHKAILTSYTRIPKPKMSKAEALSSSEGRVCRGHPCPAPELGGQPRSHLLPHPSPRQPAHPPVLRGLHSAVPHPWPSPHASRDHHTAFHLVSAHSSPPTFSPRRIPTTPSPSSKPAVASPGSQERPLTDVPVQVKLPLPPPLRSAALLLGTLATNLTSVSLHPSGPSSLSSKCASSEELPSPPAWHRPAGPLGSPGEPSSPCALALVCGAAG